MLFCEKENCKYRSKRKSSYQFKNGKPSYKCKAKNTIISFYADGNSDIYEPLPNACQCLTFRKLGDEDK